MESDEPNLRTEDDAGGGLGTGREGESVFHKQSPEALRLGWESWAADGAQTRADRVVAEESLWEYWRRVAEGEIRFDAALFEKAMRSETHGR